MENLFDSVNPDEFDQPEEAVEKKKPVSSIFDVLEGIDKKKKNKNMAYRSSVAQNTGAIDMLEDMPTLEETKQAELDAMDADSAFEAGMMDIPDDFDPLGSDESYDEDEGYDENETYLLSDDDDDDEEQKDMLDSDSEDEDDLDDEDDLHSPRETDTSNESDLEEDDSEEDVVNASSSIQKKDLEIQNQSPQPAIPKESKTDTQDTAEDEPEVEFDAEFSVDEHKRVLSGKTSFKANKRDLVKVVKEENFVSIEVLEGGIIKGDYIGAEEDVTINQNAKVLGNVEGYVVTVLGAVKGNVTGDIVIVKGTVEGDIIAKECQIGNHKVVLDKETKFVYHEG